MNGKRVNSPVVPGMQRYCIGERIVCRINKRETHWYVVGPGRKKIDLPAELTVSEAQALALILCSEKE